MQKRTRNILIAIFLITLTIRLILAFTTPNLTYESYFHVRHVEHLTHHFTPLYQDDLSYSGRQLMFLPFFHYLAAFFNLILPLSLVTKLLPNLLISSISIIVFFITKKITKNSIRPTNIVTHQNPGFI